jgi:uncharacterized protein
MDTHPTPPTNRLAGETSPYLLQHLHNPVDWYPWGPEAFEKAQREDKPLFLSIGYSTCHWCHVMAHESFEDRRIANLLNRYFVPVKVDREERPDIDAIYMTMVQAVTGSGGWPLSVFLTPEGKFFYGGTYFPPQSLYGRPGFYDLLLAIHEAWQRRREELVTSSEQLHQQVQSLLPHAKKPVNEEMLHLAYEGLKERFDQTNGGFGTAPKFPQPGVLSFLLVYHCRTGTHQALEMVEQTLKHIAGGGIHDHLGGGFHRYAVDEAWFEPHFEKMLYDQALLSRAYVQTYQVTGNQAYAHQAHDILGYVMRDMTAPSGGFYSAEDADSQGQEGLFYLWEYDEVIKELGENEGPIVCSYYGLTPKGNFKEKNILQIQKSIDDLASQTDSAPQAIEEILHRGREKLFQRRRLRIRPGRDEKIITGWNGLMISSLAQAGAVLRRPDYTEAAAKAAHFILRKLAAEGRLRRCYARSQSKGLGFLEDYAFFIQGLLDLYEADFDAFWLTEALKWADSMIRLFEDSEQGGLYLTGSDSETLVLRPKPIEDGAIPSGNSTAALVLMKLGLFTGQNRYFKEGQEILETFSQPLQQQGMGMCEMLIAADFALGPRREIVIAGATEDPQTLQYMVLTRDFFMPRSVILFHPPDQKGSGIEAVNPFISSQMPVRGKPAVYMCENYTCQSPLTTTISVRSALGNLTPEGRMM